MTMMSSAQKILSPTAKASTNIKSNNKTAEDIWT